MLARLWWYLDRLSPHQLGKSVVNVGPPLAKLSGSVQDAQNRLSLHKFMMYERCLSCDITQTQYWVRVIYHQMSDVVSIL